ncbi:hypothetical protein BU14_0125s0046 [Porphyra umbilicalis]|uniref:Uncharacterized protein n=1 Tax=Porphyra umbilicalis TaxID=2786 RepID=A0A1X6PB20_PORUM|nr:hypothetical protein BU14_0125s0046 [Porphyra umbilicalis]|eukprot:OSX78058.1 hypothetical protein BU14_0125s0046 [Porphyra umbilicalis]
MPPPPRASRWREEQRRGRADTDGGAWEEAPQGGGTPSASLRFKRSSPAGAHRCCFLPCPIHRIHRRRRRGCRQRLPVTVCSHHRCAPSPPSPASHGGLPTPTEAAGQGAPSPPHHGSASIQVGPRGHRSAAGGHGGDRPSLGRSCGAAHPRVGGRAGSGAATAGAAHPVGSYLTDGRTWDPRPVGRPALLLLQPLHQVEQLGQASHRARHARQPRGVLCGYPPSDGGPRMQAHAAGGGHDLIARAVRVLPQAEVAQGRAQQVGGLVGHVV